MCGILGGNRPDWDYHSGIECMKHRGPDGTRVCSLDDFTLAFARLAIIDLSENGMQPMFSEDGQVGIVFNGEIYGYQKLRRQLIKKGYHFYSSTDTEVILNAYLEWGEKFILKIDGMFGMAIYDKRDNTIRLFRDRLGIKPVYYYYDGTNFGFASELKGIIKMCNDVSFDIDNTAVYDYLNYLYIPEPKTYYKKIYKLRPGYRITFALYNKQIISNSPYWKLKVNEYQGEQRKQSDLIEELRYLVKESVEEQMIADVPVGTFLSGGVDSSIISYECNTINRGIESFTIGFADPRYDEARYAAELALRFNIPNHIKKFDKDIFQTKYKAIKEWYDEPFADTSAFPTHLLSELAREKIAVALTGDGGDEVFGGYQRYGLLLEREKVHANNNIVISKIYSKFLSESGNGLKWLDDMNLLQQTYAFPLHIADKTLRKKLGIDRDYDKFWIMRKYYIKDLPPITRGQYLDLKTYLPGDILTKLDRASMDVSLETRVPFLSRKIVEFSFSLSEEERCPKGEKKGLLKKAYEQEFGEKILNRPKKGFSMPPNYFIRKKSPQENLLEKVWRIKIGDAEETYNMVCRG